MAWILTDNYPYNDGVPHDGYDKHEAESSGPGQLGPPDHLVLIHELAGRMGRTNCCRIIIYLAVIHAQEGQIDGMGAVKTNGQ